MYFSLSLLLLLCCDDSSQCLGGVWYRVETCIYIRTSRKQNRKHYLSVCSRSCSYSCECVCVCVSGQVSRKETTHAFVFWFWQIWPSVSVFIKYPQINWKWLHFSLAARDLFSKYSVWHLFSIQLLCWQHHALEIRKKKRENKNYCSKPNTKSQLALPRGRQQKHAVVEMCYTKTHLTFALSNLSFCRRRCVSVCMKLRPRSHCRWLSFMVIVCQLGQKSQCATLCKLPARH